MTETPDVTRRRLHMRAMRRGMKEMDLILAGYAQAELANMDSAQLAHFDALLSENDQDLFAWITGQQAVPENFAELINQIAVRSQGIVRPSV